MAEYDELIERLGNVRAAGGSFVLVARDAKTVGDAIEALTALQARVEELEKQKKETAEALKRWQTDFATPVPNRIRQLKGKDNG